MMRVRTSKEFWTDHSDLIDGTVFPEELNKYLRAEEEKIIEYCKEKRPGIVLEAGCGRGRIVEKVHSYCKKVVGIDYSPAMTRFCSKRFKDNPNIRIYEEDISQMHFPDNYFDLGILAFNTLGNVNTDKEKVLLELKRVLKLDGELLISVYSENARDVQYETYRELDLDVLKEENNRIYAREGLISQRFSRADLEAWLQICGFKGTIEPLTDISYFVTAKGG